MLLKRMITTLFVLFCATASWADDSVILAMASAYKKGDVRSLTKLLPQARGHTLEPWAAYWTLKTQLDTANQSQVTAFYKHYAGSYQEDRLRADWLLRLGSKQDWEGFDANYAQYRMRDDKDIECYANRHDPVTIERVWMTQKDVRTGCGQVALELLAAGQMPSIVGWRKNYKPKISTELPSDMGTFTEQQRNWALGFAARAMAQNLDLKAPTVFSKVTKMSDLSDEMLGWWVRSALRVKDWRLAERVISAMSSESRNDPIWQTWLERLRQIGSGNAAQKAPAPSPIQTEPSEQAILQAKSNKGLQRALYAIKIGLRQEGTREWVYEVNLARGSMSDEERLGAAAFACQAEVWDRCISTSERTIKLVNWSQRYPTPYKDAVMARSRQAELDPAFVYGLIRQESRFIKDIKSSVGASGLMQLMPSTAHWVAQKEGVTGYLHDKIDQVDINLTLGTLYLKRLLKENDGIALYAAAAYNAGPHRVRAWREAMRNDPAAHLKDQALALAIWAENIPFTETRDYVKKVLANTEHYQKLLAK